MTATALYPPDHPLRKILRIAEHAFAVNPFIVQHPLRKWRKTQRVTLTALSENVGVGAAHLSEIERGHNVPSLGLATRLSQATGIDIAAFSDWAYGAGPSA